MWLCQTQCKEIWLLCVCVCVCVFVWAGLSCRGVWTVPERRRQKLSLRQNKYVSRPYVVWDDLYHLPSKFGSQITPSPALRMFLPVETHVARCPLICLPCGPCLCWMLLAPLFQLASVVWNPCLHEVMPLSRLWPGKCFFCCCQKEYPHLCKLLFVNPYF